MAEDLSHIRSVTIILQSEDWHRLTVEAAKRGRTVDAVVFDRVQELLADLEIEEMLEQPEEAFMALDGEVADRMGSVALERAARRRGLRFEVVGGQRHDGKKFGT